MHTYADDIQLIITITINSPTSNLELIKCTSKIINWLHRNDLLVNTSTTELLNVSRIPTIFPCVIIYGKFILHSDSVCNLGVIVGHALQ